MANQQQTTRKPEAAHAKQAKKHIPQPIGDEKVVDPYSQGGGDVCMF